MVFLDLRALTDATQLDQRVARVGLVFGADNGVVIGGGNDAKLDQLRIGDEVEADEIGPAFFERRELLLDQRLRRAP